ncbi:MAG: cupin domain-containing protein [Pseudomonadota bacterium]
MTQDPLTAIVRSLELSGAAFLDAAFTAPWAVVALGAEEDCRPVGPVPRHVIAYHVMTEGEAVLLVDRRARCQVTAGDVVFLPGNTRCVLASAPGIAPVPADDLLLPLGRDGLVRIHHGVGYSAPEAFSRAFKRETGLAPNSPHGFESGVTP